MTHDDPQLTAYALGELDDAADRAAVEAFLASDETARRLVDEIRQTAATLTRGLQTAEIPTLTPDQRQTIAAAKSEPAPLTYQAAAHRPRRLWVRWALATAACAALATAGVNLFSVRHASKARIQAGNLRQMGEGAAMYSNENKDQAAAQPQAGQGMGAGNKQVTPFGINVPTAGDRYYAQTPEGFVPRGQTSAKESLSSGTTPIATANTTLNSKVPVARPSQRYGDAANVSSPQPTSTAGGVTVAAGAVAFDLETLDALKPAARPTPGAQPATRSPVTPTPAPNPADPRWAGESVRLLRAKTSEPALAEETKRTLTPAKPQPAPDPAAAAAAAAKSVQAEYETQEVLKQQLVKNAAAAPAPALPGVIAIRKNDFPYNFSARLKEVRDASARNETEVARAALGDARKLLEEHRATLTPNEWGEANTALRFAEAQVPGTESYAKLNDNAFLAVADQPLSTFSIDVDTASYSNVRRFISQGQLPPADAVRIEELLNYFPYTYEAPANDSKDPFKANVEVAACPWNTGHRLARVAIKGKEIAIDKRPVSNLVFLIDVSGSMNEPKKLPLVKSGLKLLVNQLNENDRISIVVYAGAAGMVLPSTPADPKSRDQILAAIDNLSAGGSTNGGQGIELAYHVATQNFIKGGTNRVLLATDGDWNVGITDQTSLTHLIESQAKSGVFLSVLGFGFGNLKDSTMEKLADKGNGHYAYIDDVKEARKVLVEEMSGTLVTIAKDVKIQIEFNPAKVQSYRLIGYENRLLQKEDFNNDKIDAGEIGAGHTVTALYELTPVGPSVRDVPPAPATTAPTAPAAQLPVDPLKYQKRELTNSNELLTLKLRYKQPDGDTSTLVQTPVTDSGASYAKASEDFKFAAAVAQYGMILRNSPHKGTATLDAVLELADEGKGKDDKGYRADFLDLVKRTKSLVR